MWACALQALALGPADPPHARRRCWHSQLGSSRTCRAAMCRRICTYAAQRAHGRLEAQRAAAEDGGAAAADERRLVMADAGRLGNTSSQIGGRRPLQGCAVSPDGSTVATGDWSGMVAFWTMEDKLERLKVSQVWRTKKKKTKN